MDAVKLTAAEKAALTPENAIKAAKPPLAIMQYPAMLFVTDHLTEEFAYTEGAGPRHGIHSKGLIRRILYQVLQG